MAMSDSELAVRAAAPPEQFAGRLSESALRTISSARDGGEWGEEIDNLVAALTKSRASVSRGEWGELKTLLEEMEMPVDSLRGLNTVD